MPASPSPKISSAKVVFSAGLCAGNLIKINEIRAWIADASGAPEAAPAKAAVKIMKKSSAAGFFLFNFLFLRSEFPFLKVPEVPHRLVDEAVGLLVIDKALICRVKTEPSS